MPKIDKIVEKCVFMDVDKEIRLQSPDGATDILLFRAGQRDERVVRLIRDAIIAMHDEATVKTVLRKGKAR